MILHRIQGRADEGYEVRGNFKRIDSEDVCFNAFVNYVDDPRDEVRPQMLYGFPAVTQGGENTYVVGENVIVGAGEQDVFVRESHFSHRVIYCGEDYENEIGELYKSPYAKGFYKDMKEYEKACEEGRQNGYYIEYDPLPDTSLKDAAKRYGITEDNYFDFLYGLCISAFDKEQKLYIAMPSNSEEDVAQAKEFISLLIEALPPFLRKRFGYITYYPSNDTSKTALLPAGVNLVFIKGSRKNANNYSVCEISFDKQNSYAYYAQADPLEEDIIFMLSDYVFEGDRSNQNFFESIDRLFPPEFDIKFEAIAAYYIRYNYQSPGELLWADKLLWLTGLPTLCDVMIKEDTPTVTEGIFSDDNKIAREKLNIIDDKNFQRNISKFVCENFDEEKYECTVRTFFEQVSKPITQGERESYEEKTTALLRQEFDDVLFNDTSFATLAAGEIIKAMFEKNVTATTYEQRAEGVREVFLDFKDKKCMEDVTLQNLLFAVISPEVLNNGSLEVRKILFDMSKDLYNMPEFNRRLYDESDAFLCSVAADEATLETYKPYLMRDDILFDYLAYFAERNTEIKDGIVDKLKLDILCVSFNKAENFKDKMDVLRRNGDSSELFLNNFDFFAPALRSYTLDGRFFDITDRQCLKKFANYLETEYFLYEEAARDDFANVFVFHVCDESGIYNIDAPARLEVFLKGFYFADNWKDAQALSYFKQTADILLCDKKPLRVIQKQSVDRLGEMVREHLDDPNRRVENINGYIDIVYYKSHRLASLMGDMVSFLNMTPSAVIDSAKGIEENNNVEEVPETVAETAPVKESGGIFSVFGKFKR